MTPVCWPLLLSLLILPCQSFVTPLFGAAKVYPSKSCVRVVSNNGNLTTVGKDTGVAAIDSYRTQAQKLRSEIKSLESALVESKRQKHEMEQLKVEQWLENLLVNQTYGIDDCDGEGASVQILNSVERTAQILRDKRYSPEQVDKIFRRLTRGVPRERIEQSLAKTPLLALLVQACGELDLLEREDNPNRRWSGRIERDLRRRLFAMEWGIDPDDLK